MCKWIFLFLISLIVYFFSVPCAMAEMLNDGHKQYHFLALSDIHFDPFISCVHKVPCPLIQMLNQLPASEWEKTLAVYDKTVPNYHQDTNIALLKATLNFMTKLSQTEGVKFVMVLGDSLGHNYRHLYKKYSADKSMTKYPSFVRKTLEFLTRELRSSFPHQDVYMVTGNNDSYQKDYVSTPLGDFFKETAVVWGALINNKMQRTSMEKQFSIAGYYAVEIDNDTSLIVMNSNLFSRKAKGKNIDQAANRELDWLHHVLTKVNEKQHKAFIIMHVPEGIDIYLSPRIKLFTLTTLWKKDDIQRFQSELKQFSENIAGVFTSHLHSDSFHIITFQNKNEIPVIGISSISPIFGNDPAFKIYTYSPQLGQLTNFIAYDFPLRARPFWEKGQDFARAYLHNCRNCSILKIP